MLIHMICAFCWGQDSRTWPTSTCTGTYSCRMFFDLDNLGIKRKWSKKQDSSLILQLKKIMSMAKNIWGNLKPKKTVCGIYKHVQERTFWHNMKYLCIVRTGMYSWDNNLRIMQIHKIFGFLPKSRQPYMTDIFYIISSSGFIS